MPETEVGTEFETEAETGTGAEAEAVRHLPPAVRRPPGVIFFGYHGAVDAQEPQIVDVENRPTGGVTAYMENTCVGTPFAGHGMELDWLRTFWDYHTNPGSKPGHTLIMDEMRRAHDDKFSRCAAYENMHGKATSDGYGARWAYMSQANGIDHVCEAGG